MHNWAKKGKFWYPLPLEPGSTILFKIQDLLLFILEGFMSYINLNPPWLRIIYNYIF